MAAQRAGIFNATGVDIMDFQRARECMVEMQHIARDVSHGVEDLYLGRVPGKTSEEAAENARIEDEVIPISSNKPIVNVVPPVPPQPPSGRKLALDDEVVTIPNRLIPPSPRSGYDISDGSYDGSIESAESDEDWDRFLEFGEADFPEDMPPWEDDWRMHQAGIAYESAKELIDLVKVGDRCALMKEINEKFRSMYSESMSFVKRSGPHEDSLVEESREREEASKNLKVFSDTKDTEQLVMLNNFLQFLKRQAKAKGNHPRRPQQLQEEQPGPRDKIQFAQLVSAVRVIEKRIRTLHVKAKAEDKLKAVFEKSAVMTRPNLFEVEEDHKDAHANDKDAPAAVDDDDDADMKKEQKIEASDLLELISDQQTEIAKLQKRAAVGQQHIETYSGCLKLTQWEHEVRRRAVGEVPINTMGRRRASYLKDFSGEEQEEIFVLLEETRAHVKERLLRERTEDDPQLLVDLTKKVDPKAHLHLESEKRALKEECVQIQRYNEYLEGILRSETLSAQLNVVMQDVAVPIPKPPTPPDEFWRKMFPEDAIQDLPKDIHANSPMIKLLQQAHKMVGDLKQQRARLLPKVHAKAMRREKHAKGEAPPDSSLRNNSDAKTSKKQRPPKKTSHENIASSEHDVAQPKVEHDVAQPKVDPPTREVPISAVLVNARKVAEAKSKPRAKKKAPKRPTDQKEAIHSGSHNEEIEESSDPQGDSETFESDEPTEKIGTMANKVVGSIASASSAESDEPAKKLAAITNKVVGSTASGVVDSKASTLGSSSGFTIVTSGVVDSKASTQASSSGFAMAKGGTSGVSDSKASTLASSSGFAMAKGVVNMGSTFQKPLEAAETMTSVQLIEAEKSSKDHLAEVNNISTLLHQEIDELEAKMGISPESGTTAAKSSAKSPPKSPRTPVRSPKAQAKRRPGRLKTGEKTKHEVHRDQGEGQDPAGSELLSVQLENSKLTAEVEVMLKRIADANEYADHVEEEQKKEGKQTAAQLSTPKEKTKLVSAARNSEDTSNRGLCVEIDEGNEADAEGTIQELETPKTPGRRRRLKKNRTKEFSISSPGGALNLFAVASKAVDAKKVAQVEHDVLELYDLQIETDKAGKQLEVLEERIKNARNKESGELVAAMIAEKKADERSAAATKVVPETVVNLRHDIGKKQVELKKLRKMWHDRNAPPAQKKKPKAPEHEAGHVHMTPYSPMESTSNSAPRMLSYAAQALQTVQDNAPKLPQIGSHHSTNHHSVEHEDTPMRRFSRILQSSTNVPFRGKARQGEAAASSQLKPPSRQGVASPRGVTPLSSRLKPLSRQKEQQHLASLQADGEAIQTSPRARSPKFPLAMPSAKAWTRQHESLGGSNLEYTPMQVNSPAPSGPSEPSAPASPSPDGSFEDPFEDEKGQDHRNRDHLRDANGRPSRIAPRRLSKISGDSRSSVRTAGSRLSAMSQLRRKHAVAMGQRSSGFGVTGLAEATPTHQDERGRPNDPNQRFHTVKRTLL